MSRSVKRWHNMDIVLHGPMPSKPCPRSTYAQGRHAFTAPVRSLATSSVTTNADMQIVEVAPLLRLRTERGYQVRLIADMKQSARGPKWRTAHSPPPMPGKGSDSDRWPETTFIVFLWNPLELWKLPVLAGCLERVKSRKTHLEQMFSGLPQ